MFRSCVRNDGETFWTLRRVERRRPRAGVPRLEPLSLHDGQSALLDGGLDRGVTFRRLPLRRYQRAGEAGEAEAIATLIRAIGGKTSEPRPIQNPAVDSSDAPDHNPCGIGWPPSPKARTGCGESRFVGAGKRTDLDAPARARPWG